PSRAAWSSPSAPGQWQLFSCEGGLERRNHAILRFIGHGWVKRQGDCALVINFRGWIIAGLEAEAPVIGLQVNGNVMDVHEDLCRTHGIEDLLARLVGV